MKIAKVNTNQINVIKPLRIYIEFNELLRNNIIDTVTLTEILKIDDNDIIDLVEFERIPDFEVFYKIQDFYKKDFFSIPNKTKNTNRRISLGIVNSLSFSVQNNSNLNNYQELGRVIVTVQNQDTRNTKNKLLPFIKLSNQEAI